MLLVIDIGNTNIVLGVFQGKELLVHWRVSTRREATPDEYGVLTKSLFQSSNINPKGVRAAVLASVVPPLTATLEEMVRQCFQLSPLIVEPGIKTGMPILYDNPKEVGADRIVNAVAAFEKYGGPVIVVDFGTATTFDAISAKGEYLGGAIAPGIGISAEALFQRAAKLPRIDIVKPKGVIGKNTVSSMQAGIFYGYLSLVDGIVEWMKAELGGNAVVVATGGLAHLILAESRTVDYVDHLLTLFGLRIIYDRNEG